MDKRRIAALCAALLILSACSQQAASESKTPAVAKIDAPAPAFNEPTASGSNLTMESLRGKPVYLNFFASWCAPCNEEAPDINAIYQQYKSDGLQVVGVDILENKARAQKFVEQHQLRFPAVVDSGTLRDAYNINGMPVHVFINRDGVVKKIEIGELSKAQMVADVKAVL